MFSLLSSPTTVATALALAFLVVSYALSGFILLLWRQQRSPLRLLPRPPSPSFFFGNLAEMHDQENNNLFANWEATYGSTFVYRGFIGGCRLMTTDPAAVAYILGHAYDYPKPDFIRDGLASMSAGHDGLLTVEGETHSRQRRILNSAFTHSHIKSLSPIFWEKASQLRDIWLNTAQESDSKHAHVDALSWLSRATLDVIGLAGFGYKFNSLTDENNELATAFATIFDTARQFRVLTILQAWFPFLRKFRRTSAAVMQAQDTMHRIGLSLIEERRHSVAAELEASKEESKSGIEGDKTMLGRDILSVLIRSNITSDPSQRMSIQEILSQISTFLAAGHETTGSALTWCLYALAQAPAVQHRLREDLRALSPDSPRLVDELTRLPYLDYVVREALRVHAPVTSTMRVCMREADEIPVCKPYTDRYGVQRHSIPLRKWDIVTVPIQAINKSRKLWGNDACAFRPERWENIPDEVKAIPGLYANILTFLNGNPITGNRACIGYKFALLEIKIFLYVLVRDIEFSMDPSLVIQKSVNVVTRPYVKSEPQLGNQMPLYLRRVSEHGDSGSSPWSPPMVTCHQQPVHSPSSATAMPIRTLTPGTRMTHRPALSSSTSAA